MKSESNWKEKNLENLEKDFWALQSLESHLLKTCYLLRKKPLKDFTIEDLRIMIGQNLGLKFLIPFALEKLRKNILSEGDYFQGDLLKAVVTSNKEFWNLEPKLTKELEAIILENEEILNQNEPGLLKSYEQWKKK